MKTEALIKMGLRAIIDSVAPPGRFAAVFEDDGDTGYFYALDRAKGETPIIDAMHIYDANPDEPGDPVSLEIEWNENATTATLLINGVSQAVYDFIAKKGTCRTGFPPGHAWLD